jgi:hypothetical protein
VPIQRIYHSHHPFSISVAIGTCSHKHHLTISALEIFMSLLRHLLITIYETAASLNTFPIQKPRQSITQDDENCSDADTLPQSTFIVP